MPERGRNRQAPLAIRKVSQDSRHYVAPPFVPAPDRPVLPYEPTLADGESCRDKEHKYSVKVSLSFHNTWQNSGKAGMADLPGSHSKPCGRAM